MPCEEAIGKAKAEEVDLAVAAERFVILQYRYDDEPLACYPKNKQAEDKGCL